MLPFCDYTLLHWEISTFATGIEKLEFRYDASQRRIAKYIKHTNINQSVVLLYVYDAGGNLMAVYENYYNSTANLWNYKIKENLMYGSNRLGIYRAETTLCNIPIQSTPTIPNGGTPRIESNFAE